MIAFTIDGGEFLKAGEFEDNHRHKDINHGCIGGHISYIFTPTSIGYSIIIECCDCKEREDITDYSRW